MPTSRPPRQPEQVRNRLINAATSLLSEGQAVSIGSIADAAGVSKGAVQHHFGTREQLFAALGEAFLQEFDDALALEDASVPAALRYARLSLNAPSSEDAEGWRAMLVASVVDRSIALRWSERLKGERALDQAPSTSALLVRLAADGLWLSDVLGTYDIGAKEREELAALMSEFLGKA
ncbi:MULTISPECIES: TetR/AcrR family transcriptional regulator [unclassified Massilia]|uniref:TetR/AcrR family transcriptional regulator n=1 Tax=unclassified Massilia TaxID=2609279 RepID=UPI0018D91F67|nr:MULTISPECIES: TetR/AcrR family transcriptional regulator [unclassified Massilia]